MTEARTSSTEYKHDDTCGLFNPHHTIPTDVAEVVEAMRDMDGVEAVAGGCNGCTAPVMDDGVYYIAQHGKPDSVYFGFTSESAAYTLIGVCQQLGVPYTWDGDETTKVLVGE